MKDTNVAHILVAVLYCLCDLRFVLSQTEGQVRLVGSYSNFQGRVEIYHGDQWGTICDTQWDVRDASVVCRQLGFDVATSAPGSAQFGQGYSSQPIFLDEVDCTGDEQYVLDCHTSKWDVSACVHAQDAGVICGNDAPEGSIRLVAGSTYYGGRVEIFHNSTWGTICDDQWDMDDATVVCRQLHLGSATEAESSLSLGAGTGDEHQPIHLAYLNCDGSEGSIADCWSQDWGNHSCDHIQDAGVICEEDKGEEGELRMVGGRSELEGQVEIFAGDRWGTVCDGFWDIRDATVACRQMGFADAASAISSAYFGRGRYDQPIHLGVLECHGNETTLTNCSHWDGDVNCMHAEDAGLVCLNKVSEGDIRVTDLDKPNGGRLEIHHDGEWGTICASPGWSRDNIKVTCHQLGYIDYDSVLIGSGLPGYGPIFLSYFDCVGNESSLADCDHDDWEDNTCTHASDMIIVCYTSNYGTQIPGTFGFSTNYYESTHTSFALIITISIIGAAVIAVVGLGIAWYIYSSKSNKHSKPTQSSAPPPYSEQNIQLS